MPNVPIGLFTMLHGLGGRTATAVLATSATAKRLKRSLHVAGLLDRGLDDVVGSIRQGDTLAAEDLLVLVKS